MATILLIEDVRSHQCLISHRLTTHQFEVVIAVDGQEGLAQAQSLAPSLDLILMDIKLPEMDGWELARILKANCRASFIPIIAVTAYAMNDDRQRALAVGCDDYVSKPIDFDELLNKVRTWIGRRHCSAQIDSH